MLALTLLFCASVALPSAQGPPRILDRLAAVHPNGPPGALTATPSGSLLLVAEGGALAFIGTRTQAGFEEPLKVVRIGRRGVVPVRMRLDPDADFADGPDPEDLVYVAGGRDGLWALHADPDPTVLQPRAARVDDSPGGDPADQTSRRWCTDVDVLRVGGADWLVALFAEKDDSRLRVYPLQRVRDVVALHAEEQGHELAATVEVALGQHPSGQGEHRSFGYALAADGSDVFVALGGHGLARVSFARGVTRPEVAFGPVYGDGSHYASSPPHEVYDDLRYRDTEGTVEREDPPQFVDVAVQDFGGGHFLYAAVDHLGWARFDLSDPLEFDADMPIEHQEGIVLEDNGHGEKQILLTEDASAQRIRTYARRIDVVASPDGPVVAVAVGTRPMVIQPGGATDGRPLGNTGDTFAGVSDYGTLTGTHSYVLLYRASGLMSGEINHDLRMRGGGDRVHLVRVQSHPGNVVFFGGDASPGATLPQSGLGDSNPLGFGKSRIGTAESGAHLTYLAGLRWATGRPRLFRTRRNGDRPGRLTLAVGASIGDPELLLTAANDSGLASDGFLAVCGEHVERFYEPDEHGHDGRAAHGILFSPEAQWFAAGEEPTHYTWGAGRNAPDAGPSELRWRMKKIDPGSGLCLATPRPPELVKTIFVESPVDRFGALPRGFYNMGTLDPAYDAQNLQGWEVLFGTRAGTPDGGMLLLRDRITGVMEDAGTPDGELIEFSERPDIFVHALDTHAEFLAVDSSHPDAQNLLGPQKLGLVGPTSTFFPRLFQLPGPGSATPDRWVLALPALVCSLDPGLPIFTDPGNPGPEGYHPEWSPPAPFDRAFDHALVRFYDVTDPDPGAIVDLGSIIGPRAGTSAFRIEVVEVDGRHYAFVANFGGSLLVYDVTELADTTHPAATPNLAALTTVFAEWTPPGSISDDLPSNVMGLAVDEQGGEVHVYLAVMRIGIGVLRFDPGAAAGDRLEDLGLIQTPGSPAAVWIRVDGGTRSLLVADTAGGIRSYE